DRAAFQKVFALLRAHEVPVPDFEVWFGAYRNLFRGMIDLSRQTHREANFEQVLRWLLIRFAVPIEGKVSFRELVELFYGEYHSCRRVYPEVPSTLQRLQSMNVRMGVISNTTNPSFIKEAERKASGLDSYFDFALYSSDLPYRKPHPSIFELALARLQYEPAEVLFVGDQPRMDILGAQGVGMRAAWINRRGDALPDGVKPDYTFTTLDGLLEIHVG
ncbi:MAG: hypothetical protein COW30_02825, partial [Rhodospirillales bacterium CG15_BIG_FIL_POST_REV_8_21_14_020_66_15]